MTISAMIEWVQLERTIPKEPDFSGQWVLLSDSGSNTEPAAALTVQQEMTRTTVHGTPMPAWFSRLVVARHFAGEVSSESYDIGTTGGTVPGLSSSQSSQRERRTSVAVCWEGASLIIRTGQYFGPPQRTTAYTEHEEVWSFDGNRRLVITVSDRGSRTTPTTVRLVYRRR